MSALTACGGGSSASDKIHDNLPIDPPVENPDNSDIPNDDTPPVDDPNDDTPPVDNPNDDTPPVDDPNDDTPPVDNPNDDTPPVDDPNDDTPPVDDPDDDTPPVEAPDNTPEAFSFSPQMGAEPFDFKDSNEVTITGIDAGTSISVAGGDYRINNGNFTSEVGVINSGDMLKMRVNGSEEYSTSTTVSVNVGTYTQSFTITTRDQDQVPNDFEISNKTAIELNTEVASLPVLITGIDDGVEINISGGSYKTKEGAKTSESSLINDYDEITLFVETGDEYNKEYTAQFTLGTDTTVYTFSATTRYQDNTPNEIEFETQKNQEVSSDIPSNTVTINGIDDKVAISVTGGFFSIGHEEEKKTNGIINDGEQITLYATTGSEFEATYSAKLVIGSEQSEQKNNYEFSVLTRARNVNPSFSIGSIEGAERNIYIKSPAVEFSDFDNVDVTLTGGYYRLNDNGAISNWLNAGSFNLKNGDTLEISQLSSNAYNTKTNVSLISGDWDSEIAFYVTTKEDIAPTLIVENTRKAKDGTVLLAGKDEIILTFDESMTDDLALSGELMPACEALGETCIEEKWNPERTELTLELEDNAYWPVGKHSFNITITGDALLGLNEEIEFTVLPVFETDQAASVVVGSALFTNGGNVSGYDLNVLFRPSDVTYDKEFGLLITDRSKNRVLKFDDIPTENKQAADDYFGLQHPDTDNPLVDDQHLNEPSGAQYFNGDIYISDTQNNRTLGINGSGENLHEQAAHQVIGQFDFLTSSEGGCGIENGVDGIGLLEPKSIRKVLKNGNAYSLVSDTEQSRLLIWKDTDPQNVLILGQDDDERCHVKHPDIHGLASIYAPQHLWTDGNRIVMADSFNNRILFWNTWPEQNGQSADKLYGQNLDTHYNPNWEQGSGGQTTRLTYGLHKPMGVSSNGYQLCVADTWNHRVLVWNDFPINQFDQADYYIGQPDNSTVDENAGGGTSNMSRDSLRYPEACLLTEDQLIIADTQNARVLIYNALNPYKENR